MHRLVPWLYFVLPWFDFLLIFTKRSKVFQAGSKGLDQWLLYFVERRCRSRCGRSPIEHLVKEKLPSHGKILGYQNLPDLRTRRTSYNLIHCAHALSSWSRVSFLVLQATKGSVQLVQGTANSNEYRDRNFYSEVASYKKQMIARLLAWFMASSWLHLKYFEAFTAMSVKRILGVLVRYVTANA